MHGLFREEISGSIRPLRPGDRLTVEELAVGSQITFNSGDPVSRLIPVCTGDDKTLLWGINAASSLNGFFRLFEILTGYALRRTNDDGEHRCLIFEITLAKKPREAREGLLT